MHRKALLLVVLFLAVGLCCSLSFAQEKGAEGQAVAEQPTGDKEKVLAVAIAEVKAQGYVLDGVDIIYDDGNQLWERQIGTMTDLTASPNFGIFKKGFMNNYRTVFFDFQEPLPDLWVFVDKDSGEVLEVYTAK